MRTHLGRRQHDVAALVTAARAPLSPPTLPRQPDPPRPPGSSTLVLYGCCSCPWCYLASQRSDRLTAATAVQWRMVAPDPHLHVTGQRLDTDGRRHLQADLDAARTAMLPGERLPEHAPAFLPNTAPAVVGYAEADGAGVADPVRRLLFDAYWNDGADIGNPEVLRRLLAGPIQAGHSTSWPLRESGYAVTLAGGPITNGAYRRIQQWRTASATASKGAVPSMVSDDGTVTGADVLRQLADLVVGEEPARPDEDQPHPAESQALWLTVAATETGFLSTRGPVFQGTGGISGSGYIRPAISEPGKPDGEVAT